jgi:hypothetical protein
VQCNHKKHIITKPTETKPINLKQNQTEKPLKEKRRPKGETTVKERQRTKTNLDETKLIQTKQNFPRHITH